MTATISTGKEDGFVFTSALSKASGPHGYQSILLVFDGLGINVLEKHLPSNAFLRKNIKSQITSVFPSTTTAAITSIISGKTPNEHGWIGWSCYFNEIDKCVDLFSGNQSGIAEGIPACDEHIPNKVLGFENLLFAI